MILGLDLSDKNSQLSYVDKSEQTPVVAELKNAVTRLRCVPSLLAMEREIGIWYYGTEAQEQLRLGNALAADRLIERAAHRESIELEGKSFLASELLLLFVRKLLEDFIKEKGGFKEEDRLCVCFDRELEELSEVMELFKEEFKGVTLNFISRNESFYQYMIHQKAELWHQYVVILEYEKDAVLERSFYVNRNTRPMVCSVNVRESRQENIGSDENFLAYCSDSMDGRIVTSVYMLGEEGSVEKLKKTVGFLCSKRRVFQGGNLYSRGACYAALELAKDKGQPKKYIFLGKDKLKSNVSLQLVRGREEIRETLVDAGVNWYDVKAGLQLYLGEERELRLLLTPISGKNEYYRVVRLGSFPEREKHTTRVMVDITMSAPDELLVRVEDLGFGSYFKSSKKIVEEKIKIREDM